MFGFHREGRGKLLQVIFARLHFNFVGNYFGTYFDYLSVQILGFSAAVGLVMSIRGDDELCECRPYFYIMSLIHKYTLQSINNFVMVQGLGKFIFLNYLVTTAYVRFG